MPITIAVMDIMKGTEVVRRLTPAEARVVWKFKDAGDEKLTEILPDYSAANAIKVYVQTFGADYAVVEE
jgi:hypothetical protein